MNDALARVRLERGAAIFGTGDEDWLDEVLEEAVAEAAEDESGPPPNFDDPPAWAAIDQHETGTYRLLETELKPAIVAFAERHRSELTA
jgi:hypothetical protein